jgi:hypothetical protein
MSSIPQPLITGTIIYLVIAVVLQAVSVSFRATGVLSKDNAGYVCGVYVVAINSDRSSSRENQHN